MRKEKERRLQSHLYMIIPQQQVGSETVRKNKETGFVDNECRFLRLPRDKDSNKE